jgi:hypothetical protein
MFKEALITSFKLPHPHFPVGAAKNRKTLTQHSRSPGINLDPASAEYTGGLILTQQHIPHLSIMFLLLLITNTLSWYIYTVRHKMCSVLRMIMCTHKHTIPRMNIIFWSSSTELMAFKVPKSHAATKRFECHLCNGFVRLTLRNRERRFTSATGNGKYS